MIRALAALVLPLVAPPALAPAQDDPVAEAEALVERAARSRRRDWRDEAWREAMALAADHAEVRPVLVEGLAEFWDGTLRRMDSRRARQVFEELVVGRARLDELRTRTLALVRDEEAYPYPFEPPEATPEVAERHRRTQREIDGLVAEMRELWDDGPRASLTRELRRGGERSLWARRQREQLDEELGIEVELERGDLPAWMLALPVECEGPVDLSTFAVDPAEADRLARDRAVRERNRLLLERLEATAEGEEERIRAGHERRQVEVTNDYRSMLGLHVLAWNDRLHDAVRNHSEYLFDVGGLGHDQPNVLLETFGERAKTFGYPGPVWENCHRGSRTARAAHETWIHSSAHHRTILGARTTEMATANAGTVWVQKFGLDTAFESEIQCHPWRD